MTTHPPTDPIADLDARLDVAHAMPGGPARERAITEAALAAVVTEIGRRAPSVHYVEFDWAPYGGLDAYAFLDSRGNEIEVPGLAGDLAQWTTDLRSPDMAAMIPISPRGPFLLDLQAPQPFPAPAGHSSPAPADSMAVAESTGTMRGAHCPVQLGDEVIDVDAPDLRAVVTTLRCRHGILHECEVECARRGRVWVLPWELLPADGASERWHEQMRTLYALQRAHTSDLVRQDSHALADRAEVLSRTLAAMAVTLRLRQLPEPDSVRTEFAARDIDEALQRLSELHTELARLDEFRLD
ncbi:hypothetical protein [Nocardia nova]|uniref:hypothetical protein n=1 Tax=Nocardia nova TaxID=37330 RepID=UPI0007A4A60E|nr:hypothetical protein [Nocardia nova]